MIPLRLVGRTSYRPYVTFWLLVFNTLIFGYELFLLSRGELTNFFREWGYNPCSIGVDPVGEVAGSLFLSMFLHGNIAHLVGNMLFLWIFGGRIEEYFGHRNYLIFYLASGIGATLAFQFANSGLCIPAIGASGAISGILGAFLWLYPGVKVETVVVFFRLLFKTFKMPAILMLGYWFLMQLFYGVLSLGSNGAAFGGVAFWAHIGGFVAGLGIAFVATMYKQPPKPDPFAHLDD